MGQQRVDVRLHARVGGKLALHAPLELGALRAGCKTAVPVGGCVGRTTACRLPCLANIGRYFKRGPVPSQMRARGGNLVPAQRRTVNRMAALLVGDRKRVVLGKRVSYVYISGVAVFLKKKIIKNQVF